MALQPPRTDSQICGQPRRGEVDPETGERTGVGLPCRRWAGQGTNHVGEGLCSWHGGTLPGQLEKAHEAIAIREAKQGLAKLGHSEPLSDIGAVYNALMQTGADLESLRLALQDEVRRLETVATTHPIRGPVLRPEIQGLLATTKLVVELLTKIAALNLADKKMALEERQWEWATRIVETYLRRRGFDPTDSDVRGELHAITIEMEDADA